MEQVQARVPSSFILRRSASDPSLYRQDTIEFETRRKKLNWKDVFSVFHFSKKPESYGKEHEHNWTASVWYVDWTIILLELVVNFTLFFSLSPFFFPLQITVLFLAFGTISFWYGTWTWIDLAMINCFGEDSPGKGLVLSLGIGYDILQSFHSLNAFLVIVYCC